MSDQIRIVFGTWLIGAGVLLVFTKIPLVATLLWPFLGLPGALSFFGVIV